MAVSAPAADVVEQAAGLIDKAVRELHEQKFKEPGEVRPLVQQVQAVLEAQTRALNIVLRPTAQLVRQEDRISDAEDAIEDAERTLSIFGRSLEDLHQLSQNRVIGSARSFLSLEEPLGALVKAKAAAEFRLERARPVR